MTAILTEFTLTHFKSYRQARLPLGPLTVLIGANASGKSNAIEALRFMQWMAQKQIDIHQNILRPDSWRLDVRGSKETWLSDNHPCRLSCYFNNDSEYRYIVEIKKGNDSPNSIFLTFEDDTTARFNDSPSSLEILRNLLFIDTIPSAMREYSSKSEQYLFSDGSNLSSVLYHLCQIPSQKQILLDFIQSLPEQLISDIGFIETPRNEVMLTLTETFGHRQQQIDITLLSDGTLRVLTIAAALLSAPEGSPIVIEEIDNGVHPSRAKHLLTRIREIANQRNLRVLLSTHNPALMDALPDEALPDVVFCYRDPQEGDSRLIRLQDLDDYPGLILQGPLGQLVTTGIVDRFVKSPTPPHIRKDKALQWLTQLREA